MTIFQNQETIILFSIAIIFSLTSLVLTIIIYKKNKLLQIRYEYFMLGRDAENLEEFFLELQEQVDFLSEENVKNKVQIRETIRLARRSYQKIGLVKYDGYNNSSGKQSFALALLDFTNSGFIINCLKNSSGDKSMLYIKEVDVGRAEILGQEEKRALDIALGYKVKERDE